MTRTQRRTHLLIWLLVGPAAAALITLALRARPNASIASTPAQTSTDVRP